MGVRFWYRMDRIEKHGLLWKKPYLITPQATLAPPPPSGAGWSA